MHRRASLFLMLAWAFGLLGLLLGIVVEPLWFARFGSVVVLFAVMSEYMLLHSELNVLYNRLETVTAEDDMPDLTPSKWHRKKVWMAHLTVVVGTLIWGFGDLLL
ncbi:hypothetical protein THMIRHAS_14650 [Thiosulfatimonas sediminis]|uniref:Uncharacterized protein n=1 Tax=Thiosulfatimonas sediminis TaxID=2675054 RepID=A0A6F8PVB8_9GAMM|nr:hypothetical protein [Thiosulfatimonas sediminis]BBP46092.1 hypothetical protein THMIRHAS_14650 [Thiosulfatimonas sediminis]